MLPQRRNELYQAQIAMWMAKDAGVKNVKLQDFLFDREEEIEQGDDYDELESAKKFFGFNPIN